MALWFSPGSFPRYLVPKRRAQTSPARPQGLEPASRGKRLRVCIHCLTSHSQGVQSWDLKPVWPESKAWAISSYTWGSPRTPPLPPQMVAYHTGGERAGSKSPL